MMRVFVVEYNPHDDHVFVSGGWDDTIQVSYGGDSLKFVWDPGIATSKGDSVNTWSNLQSAKFPTAMCSTKLILISTSNSILHSTGCLFIVSTSLSDFTFHTFWYHVVTVLFLLTLETKYDKNLMFGFSLHLDTKIFYFTSLEVKCFRIAPLFPSVSMLDGQCLDGNILYGQSTLRFRFLFY